MANWAPSDGNSLPVDVGTSFDCSASPNVKGAWNTLHAGLLVPAHGLVLSLMPHAGVRDHLWDLGIGAAGSEQVIVANLIACKGNSNLQYQYTLPITIPAGVRIAGRHQGSTGTSGLTYNFIPGVPGFLTQAYGRCETVGAVTADSGGTSVDPGGVANTYGAWTELTASCSFAVSALMLGVGNQLNSARTSMFGIFQVGIGAAGSEQAIATGGQIEADAATDIPARPVIGPFPVAIPKGSRIAVRRQCSITDATDRLFDLVGYLFG